MQSKFLNRNDIAPYLNAEQLEFREVVFRALERHATPEYLRHCDENKAFPEELVKLVADQGWFAVTLPEEYGGVGGYLEMVGMLEAMSYYSSALARYWNINVNMVGGAICSIGSPELRQKLIPLLAEGKTFFAFALSENGSGSDAASLQTTGRMEADDIVLNGTKMWITGANRANHILTACRTAKMENKQAGISLVLVPGDSAGLKVNPIDMLGGHLIRTCEVNLDNVKVPSSLLVGDLHKGWMQLLGVLAKERIALGAICVGAMQAAFDLALSYAKERKQFGKSIASFQINAHKLADMQTLIDASRLLVYRGARMLADGIPCNIESSQAKYFGADSYMRVATDGLQLMGANGYSMEYPMQRHYREAKLFQIFGGTNEIQRNIVSRDLTMN
jgi:alkylation response protein AidB-like acyl-CoA dehydrogenase